MVTTTKVVNYTIQKGTKLNSVNATVTSTPGFNMNYLTQLQGILKILQLCLTVTGLGLIASRYQTIDNGYAVAPYYDSSIYIPRELGLTPTFPRPANTFLNGEVYYLCAHAAALTLLIIFLGTYLFSTVSAMVITKTSKLDMVMDALVAVMLLAAGIVQLAMTVYWGYDPDFGRRPPLMWSGPYAIRMIAGVVALVNAVLFFVSYAFARRDLYGREPEKAQLNSSLLRKSQRSTGGENEVRT